MDTNTIVVASIVAIVIVFTLLRKKNTNEQRESRQLMEDLQRNISIIHEALKNNTDQNHIEFTKKYNEMNQKLEKNFEAVANKSLAQNIEVAQAVSAKGIELCLKPLVSEIKNYQEKMEVMIKNETNGRAIMLEGIRSVNESSHGFSEEAKKFSVSLRGNIHALGKFGEDSLQNILDASGYNEGKDYLRQKTLASSAASSGRPDFLILAPGKRAVVADSKLSMNSFMNYMEEADETKKKKHAQDLLKNISTHVSELSKKEYQNITEYEVLGYVLMYVASDAAISIALSEDNTLMRSAIQKNVLIVGPTTMMATLKTIDFLWREEKQKENYKEIAATGKSLFEKFKLFADRMKEVQKNLDKANEAFSVAYNHLNRGDTSLVAEAQKLKELGINTEKEVA